MRENFVSIELDDGQKIWVEVAEGEINGDKLQQIGFDKSTVTAKAISSTIKNFSQMVLRSLSELSEEGKTPEKISLEFAVKFVGEAAIPTIAKGVAEGGLTVNIEWVLSKEAK